VNLALSVLIAAGLFTSRELADPPPIMVVPERNSLQLLAATVDAASGTGWKVQIKDQETIRAVYERAQHSAEVQLTVAPESISLTYVSSKNLAFSEEAGEREIHKAYLGWTNLLIASIKKRLASMCTDLSSLAEKPNVGLSYKELAEATPFLDNPVKARAVKSSSGIETGYVVREYVAYFPNGRPEDCGPVSVVFYNNHLVSVMRTSLQGAALAAYTDVLRYLVDNKQISFADAEFERMSQKVDTVMPLDPPRRDELLRFVEWQTQRLTRSETTRQEYEYLLAQKEAEVQERQSSIQMKEQELDLLRQHQYQQRASLDLQRQQLAAQRSLAIGQALANLNRSLSYRPNSLSCTSTSFGDAVQTYCH